MSNTPTTQTVSNFEIQWNTVLGQTTQFLAEWGQEILRIDHLQQDADSVIAHYQKYASAWEAIRLAVVARYTEGNILLPWDKVFNEVEGMCATVLTRCGDVYKKKSNWVAASESYKISAGCQNRPNRENPSAGWKSLLESWQLLLSAWGQTIEQSGDILNELLETSQKNSEFLVERIKFEIQSKTHRRSKERERYEEFLKEFGVFEASFKEYSIHWWNCFYKDNEDESESTNPLSSYKALENGDPTLETMNVKVVTTHRTIVNWFQPNPPEVPATTPVWRR